MEGTGKQKKIENIQALRGVAILLVLLRHMQTYQERYTPHAFLGHFKAIGDSGVDLFFAISGCVMVAVTREGFGSPLGAWNFLWRRLTRIYPLYWFYSLIVLSIYLVHPEVVNGGPLGSGMSVVKSFLLWPQRSEPILTQGWTLIFEMYFYATFAGILLWPRRRFGAMLAAWAAFVVCGMGVNALEPGLAGAVPVWGVATSSLTLEFLGGCAVGLLIRNGRDGYGRLALGAGVCIMIAGVVVGTEGSRVLFYGGSAVLIVYGAIAVERRHKWALPRALRSIGDVSYSIYLSHILVLAVLARAWARWVQENVWSDALMLVCLPLVTIVAGMASYRLVEGPVLEFFRDGARGVREGKDEAVATTN